MSESSRWVACVAMLLLLLATGGCGSLPLAPAQSVYERVERASVEVLVSGRLDGSGWFADSEGHVVTAAHIVAAKPGQPIEVVSPVVGRRSATLVAVDMGHDLALLKVDGLEGVATPYLQVAAAPPRLGEDVFVFGTPMFRHGVTLHGRVARARPSYEYLPGYGEYVLTYNVVGAAPHGSSGGCWVDRRGRVVGNQSGLMMHNRAQTGVVFVIPPQPIARLIATREDAVTPTLNLACEELWERSTEFIGRFPAGIEGVVPVIIEDNGVAAKAKLSSEVVITALDGEPVRYRDDLLRMIRQRQPGDTVTLTIAKPDDHSSQEIEIEVAARQLPGRGV